MVKQISLETVLNARRVLDHAACSMPKEFYELARKEYLNQLNLYKDETTNKEAFKLFVDFERQRIKLLTQLNSAGSVDVGDGINPQVRIGIADPGEQSSSL